MGSIFRHLRNVLNQGEPPAELEPEGLTIRTMTPRDLNAVNAIESVSFGSPWRPTSYARAIRETRQQFFTAERHGYIVGYAGFWVEHDMAHIAKVAVHPDYRRQGIATAMLKYLLDQIRRFGLGRAYLEVRRSNAGAQELYRRFGFVFERIQPHAYPNDGEDAFVLVRNDLLIPAKDDSRNSGAQD